MQGSPEWLAVNQVDGSARWSMTAGGWRLAAGLGRAYALYWRCKTKHGSYVTSLIQVDLGLHVV